MHSNALRCRAAQRQSPLSGAPQPPRRWPSYTAQRSQTSAGQSRAAVRRSRVAVRGSIDVAALGLSRCGNFMVDSRSPQSYGYGSRRLRCSTSATFSRWIPRRWRLPWRGAALSARRLPSARRFPLSMSDSQGVREAIAKQDAQGEPTNCRSAQAFNHLFLLSPSLKRGILGFRAPLESV